jgi:hypothetical protein
MHTSDALHTGIIRTPCRAAKAATALALLLAVPSDVWSNPADASVSAALPEGTIERRVVEFEAPEVACVSYAEAYRERLWLLNVPSPAAFGGMLERLRISEANRATLLNPEWWRPNTAGGGFEVRPPAELLRSLSPAERSALYGLLARWQPNRPERWPLVFPDRAAIARLRTAGHAPALVDLVETCSYPFAGGLAFSDFSLLAGAVADQQALVRFLQDASTATGFLPRLKVRTALSVSAAMAYWTVDNNNPFARPILEALLQSETDTGTELTALMPGATRVLSHNIDPEEVRHDTSLTSFVISSTLSGVPQTFTRPDEFQRWLDREFVRIEPPYRYGDLMILERPGGPSVRYACAYVADNFVFAKDPVGLGLWRFMYLGEVLSRNPHFSGGSWAGYRRRAAVAQQTAAAAPHQSKREGPWGVLRHSPINLAPPDHWLDTANLFRPQDWTFLIKDWNQIEALLRRSQLTPAQLASLLDPAIRSTDSDGSIVLKAPPAIRHALSPISRETIYNFLGLHGANPSHHIPLVLPEDAAAYERAGLNPGLQEALQRLAYRRKGLLCLSDTDLLKELLTDENEGRRLKRLLLNTPALQVELTRDSTARPADVVAYWKKNDGRSTAALLRWFERSPELDAVDISNLLPPIPQQFLNIFPDALASGHANCFWTSLNFFAREPDNRFLAGEPAQPGKQDLIEQELAAKYHPVAPPYQFGDVLCLTDPRPVGFGIVHMMNYIADDIVLTKNGFSSLAPVVFMRMADVDRLYPTMFDLQLRGFRRIAPNAR